MLIFILLMPEVGKNPIDHIYKNGTKYNNERTANIVNILLFAGVGCPAMVNEI